MQKSVDIEIVQFRHSGVLFPGGRALRLWTHINFYWNISIQFIITNILFNIVELTA